MRISASLAHRSMYTPYIRIRIVASGYTRVQRATVARDFPQCECNILTDSSRETAVRGEPRCNPLTLALRRSSCVSYSYRTRIDRYDASD